ncbi:MULTISPECIES: enoyl-CoA hydratase/isomerase family protein [Metallosphaera]|uniref:enoyl-CoA hydratase/isomerase family protein n=1 Tax=Metallosphaera TaxID=41980 RepID=UPI001F060658|nr:enoyl-CoA hydratase-related protein [Metallosphaera sedula]MCH1771143.1 enoyl-CoA hydratase-related protein [Metallosphaera sedula]MCP6729515.1 enoyl-CoA hydratase-related protein [Metallosphaera sedula]
MRTVIVEKGDVGIIRLNRPEKLNAINMEMVYDLVEALNELKSQAKAVIITGNGKAFSAGADVKEMLDMSIEQVTREGHMPLWDALRGFRKPVIAALNGVAAGGGLELAMACDMIVAGESARLGQPEINLGIIPGAGGTQRLTRTVGKYRAMEMVLTGRLITAWEAYRMGLVTKVVPDEALIPEAMRLAREIAGKSGFAVELGKEAVNRALDTLLQQGLDLERRNFYVTLVSQDGREGMKAFLEKRKPEWKT